MFRTRKVGPVEQGIVTSTEVLNARKRVGHLRKSHKHENLPVDCATALPLRRVLTRDSAISISSISLPSPTYSTHNSTEVSELCSSARLSSPPSHLNSPDATEDPNQRLSSPSIRSVDAGFNCSSPDVDNILPLPPPPGVSKGEPISPAPVDDQGVNKAPIPWRTTNMQSAWTVLNDDDSWGTSQEWHQTPSEDTYSNGGVFSMQLVNPLNGRWGRSPRVGPGSSSRRANRGRNSCRRACLLSTLGLLITAVSIVIIVVTIRAHQRDKFDPQAGPRGGLPAPPPGPPLPVLNVLDMRVPTNASAGVYFGASIDWTKEDPQSFNKALGHNAAIVDGYYMISETLERVNTVNSSGISHTIPDYFNWTAGLIGGTGAIMGMTLMPHKGLDQVSIDAMSQLGQKCAEINRVGIPILLRFAPEMNGNWYPWGQSPVKYREAFRNLAIIVRNATNFELQNATLSNRTMARTAMVWAPAAGQGYPYIYGQNGTYAPRGNDTRLTEMDTNGDGVVDENDDPFLPYYPGDEYVDWIGITALFNTSLGRNATVANALAFTGDTTVVPAIVNSTTSNNATGRHPVPSVNNINTALPVIAQNLTNKIPPVGRDVNGTSFESIVSGYPGQWSVYELAKLHKKPLIVGETGIEYLSAAGIPTEPSELTVKKAWWSQVYNETLFKNYPLIRAVVWYDYSLLLANSSITLDYSFTRNETITRAFVNTTDSLPRGTLIYANDTMADGALINGTALGVRNSTGGIWVNMNMTLPNGTVVRGKFINGAWVPNGNELPHHDRRDGNRNSHSIQAILPAKARGREGVNTGGQS
ncbi:hypothetical protein SpCBS45565_g01421 [Spizellomyces sp. 'palustris']|nr:hypothetical protein SpCBS45565_g01421 [Spizellomyces sp. 'palustris']